MMGLAQMLGLAQQAGGTGGGAGILGQEIAANPTGMQGFMGQADLQPQVGAQQAGSTGGIMDMLQNPAYQKQMQQMMNGGQQQQAPTPAPLPQGRQTLPMPSQNGPGQAPQRQGLLGRMF